MKLESNDMDSIQDSGMLMIQYSGKLSTSVCKEAIVHVMKNLPYKSMNDIFNVCISDNEETPWDGAALQEKEEMVVGLSNPAMWVRDRKELLDDMFISVFKEHFGIVVDTAKKRYRRHFSSKCAEVRVDVTEISDTELLLEWECG